MTDCQGSWLPTRIPDDFADPTVDVSTCSGCGEVMVIHRYRATNFPPGTSVVRAVIHVLRGGESCVTHPDDICSDTFPCADCPRTYKTGASNV